MHLHEPGLELFNEILKLAVAEIGMSPPRLAAAIAFSVMLLCPARREELLLEKEGSEEVATSIWTVEPGVILTGPAVMEYNCVPFG
jgi:hypothetical protein